MRCQCTLTEVVAPSDAPRPELSWRPASVDSASRRHPALPLRGSFAPYFIPGQPTRREFLIGGPFPVGLGGRGGAAVAHAEKDGLVPLAAGDSARSSTPKRAGLPMPLDVRVHAG
eukprot:scaffold2434_cov116-Isochrysis_galbana.AAC.7